MSKRGKPAFSHVVEGIRLLSAIGRLRLILFAIFLLSQVEVNSRWVNGR
jgi:hypothetical protein